jgi:hypothetical protein
MKPTRPLTLENAPMQYAPHNELGVVFLFADIARRLQFRIEEIKAGYPDCIAYKRIGNEEKLVRIEFEYNSRNFVAHKHDPSKCDCIVCWHHDWPDIPESLEVIELKRYFGVSFKVWIQPVIKKQWTSLEEGDEIYWGLSKRATPGDLLLMYRCYPAKCITEIFTYYSDKLVRMNAGWREGDAYFAIIKRLCNLESPIFLDDMRNHNILKTSSFIRKNMQGNLLVSEYWHYLYDMIIGRNPKVNKILEPFSPDKV